MDYRETARAIKQDSVKLGALGCEVRNGALYAIKKALIENKEAIFEANREDMEQAKRESLPAPILGRLKFDEHKLDDVTSGIESLISIKDPIKQTVFRRELDEGLVLERVTCPIGVIGVIFESRPDALVQISALCIKSGNCAILKGGSEAARTNRALFDVIRSAGLAAGLPDGFINIIEDREGIDELLKCDDSVDLIIPRGSNAFVKYIMDNSRIPVMGHADGICCIYAHEDADVEKSVRIIMDAKTQYVAACNAAETLLVHRNAANKLLPALAKAAEGKVALRGFSDVKKIIECETAKEEDCKTEYLDYILTVKIVDSIEEAIEHINRYGSHHTDCILTESDEAAEKFMTYVDSAGVYRNCSTRFADGFRYGFGAEVGISTGKLHARGPVGVEGLVTYKYRLTGNGQIVADYAEGISTFKFREL
ncbi:MAG: glutamate-5-semialdehyde dehydrogenase [Eubacteriales Family XIII. Incertae Sedis bacterium]|nr:MAG: glutamate-5-semialdehyde dehydrogenase [Clostridiales Family XIII bacterium]